MSNEHIVILKNDAVGDLVHSLKAIDNITQSNDVEKITIFLSKLSKNFNFLFDHPKIKTKIINYDLTFVEKIKLFYFILVNKIDRIYILAPKNFYYFLPLFFFKIKFYAICIDNINNYKRPAPFFRKLLFKYVVNDRSAIFKRKSSAQIQNELTFNVNSINKIKKIEIKINSELNMYLPKNYFYFHAKKKILDELGWGIKELKLVFNELLKFSENVVLTKDIELDINSGIFKKNFNSYDFNTKEYIDKSQKIIFYDNIDGENLYNVIRLSKKVIAFHGMMTNLASINNVPVLDLFYTKINNWNDYRNYRNSFYEFKPKYNNYDFIIPKKNINQTIKKMKFSLNK